MCLTSSPDTPCYPGAIAQHGDGRSGQGAGMADDAARIAQLEAEVAGLREREATLAAANAALAQEVEHLRPTLVEAPEQQTVTAEVLRVIAGSPADLQRVLNEVAESAFRHSRSTACSLCLREGDTVWTVALAGEQSRVPVADVGEVNP